MPGLMINCSINCSSSSAREPGEMFALPQRRDLEEDVQVCKYEQEQLLNREIVIVQITAAGFYELRLSDTVVLSWGKPPVILIFQTVSFYTSIAGTLNEQRLTQRLDSSSNNIKSCPKEERLNAEVWANHYEAHAALRLCNVFLCNFTKGS